VQRIDRTSLPLCFSFRVFVCQLVSPSADAPMNGLHAFVQKKNGLHACTERGGDGFPLTDLRRQPTIPSQYFFGLQRNPNYPCQKGESELPRMEGKHLKKKSNATAGQMRRSLPGVRPRQAVASAHQPTPSWPRPPRLFPVTGRRTRRTDRRADRVDRRRPFA